MGAKIIISVLFFNLFILSINSMPFDDDLTTTYQPESNETVCALPPGLAEGAFVDAHEIAHFLKNYGNALAEAGFVLQFNQAGGGFFSSGLLTPEERLRYDESEMFLIAAQIIKQHALLNNGENLASRDEFLSWLEDQGDCPVYNINHYCTRRPPLPCNYAILYRTFCGSCNNLRHLRQGARMTPYSRLLPAFYDDDVYSIRKSVTGEDLPSPRLIGTTVFVITDGNNGETTTTDTTDTTDETTYETTTEEEDLKFRTDETTTDIDTETTTENGYVHIWHLPNVAAVIYGQTIVHDFAKAKLRQHGKESGPGIHCCSADGSRMLDTNLLHPACDAIHVPENDTFYSQYNIRCLHNVRSQTVQEDECKVTAGEQVNTISSYIDGSFVYGSTLLDAHFLRTFEDGKLKLDEYEVLPVNEDGRYFAGDARVSQTPQLAFFHSIYYREHNRIAEILQELNPNWPDEILYQEARRLIIAQIQHSTYEEWLPAFFGQNYTYNHGLRCTDPPCEVYDEDVDGTTINDYTTTVGRFFHMYVPDALDMINLDGEVDSRPFTDLLGQLVYLQTNYDDVVRGVVAQPMNNEGFPFELLNLLFHAGGPGVDLLSLDIQRGRDHGLPPYCQYREYCGFGKVDTFEDLAPLIPEEHIEKLRSVYANVHDIDFIIGTALEQFRGFFSPTMRCLAAEQFKRFMYGDRFYYTNTRSMRHPFTRAQLQEINNHSFARLICDNTDIDVVARNSFLTIGENNEEVSCDSIPSIDFSHWKQTAAQAYIHEKQIQIES